MSEIVRQPEGPEGAETPQWTEAGATGQVRRQAEHQAQNAANTVHRWADELAQMAERAPTESPVRGAVSRAADGGHRAADYLTEHGVGGTVEQMQDVARRRPVTFLGGAALAGFAVGRLAKAGRAQAEQDREA